MKIYISGPITGTDDYMERFQEVERRLTTEGHTVFNPASVNSKLPRGTTYEEYMKVSFCLIEIAEAIYMMNGWEKSKGATKELNHARVKGKETLFEDERTNQKVKQRKITDILNEIYEEITNLRRVMKTEEDEKWNRAIYECESILWKHINQEPPNGQ